MLKYIKLNQMYRSEVHTHFDNERFYKCVEPLCFDLAAIQM